MSNRWLIAQHFQGRPHSWYLGHESIGGQPKWGFLEEAVMYSSSSFAAERIDVLRSQGYDVWLESGTFVLEADSDRQITEAQP